MRFITVVFCSVLSSVASAATLRVPQDFAKIQDAVDAAVPGDTIKIAKGTFFENVVVPVGLNDLKIRGAGKGTIVDARPFGPVGSGPGFEVTANGFSLDGVTVRFALGFTPFGVVISGNDARVRRVNVIAGDANGIGIAGNDALLEQCEVRGCETGAMVMGLRAQVRKLTVRSPQDDGLIVLTTDGLISQCRVYDAGGSGIVAQGQNLVVEKNVVDGSMDDGILVDCVGDAIVRSNKARNVAGMNGAIAVGSATGGLVTANLATDCNVAALYLAATLTAVDVTKNRGTRCGASLGETFHVESFACTLVGNRAQDSNGDGFAFVGLANLATKNVALRSALDGFEISASTVLGQNSARSNHAEGFAVSALGVEMTANTAMGNRTDIASTVAFDVFTSNHFGSGGVGVPPQIDD